MPQLSQRTRRLIEKGNESPLGAALFKTFANQYDSEKNPWGVVNAGLAENSLLQPWLKNHFESSLDLQPTDFTYGESFAGSSRLLRSLCSFYDSYIHPFTPIEPSHLGTGNGLSAVLDHLASVICDPGEAWIIPAPYYNAFEGDVGDRSGVGLVAVDIAEGEHGTPAEVERLDQEMTRRAKRGGAKVRAVLLTNPHNPLGFCYSKETLLAYCHFAEKWDIFLISDEIYATSVYESDFEQPLAFTSVLSLDVAKEVACDPARIIQLYGASKDFGANGLRIGVIVAQHNPELHRGLGTTAWTLKISSAADALWYSILSDLREYIKLNQAALADAYAFTTEWLRAHRPPIPHRPAQAGHFILVDFNRYLGLLGSETKEEQVAKEVELLNDFVAEGVYLGPGFSYRCSSAGTFRLTFSLRRADLLVALQRIEAVLDRRRGP